MHRQIPSVLFGPLLLLVAGCSEERVLEPQDASFNHAPGHGKGKGDGDGPAYDVVTLGTLGGSSQAWAINNAAVVVGDARNAEGQTRAFVWTESAGMRDLLGASYEPFNQARHINEGGQVAGLSTFEDGFVYDLATQQVTWLPPLPDHTGTQAIAINAAGVVVGRSMGPTAAGTTDWRTVVWTATTPAGYVEPLDLDCPVMQIYTAVNVRGDIVANECRGTRSPPFLWIRDGDGYNAPLALGTLGGSGTTHATGIDDRGRASGWSTAPGGARRAVLWHPDDYARPIDLGDAALVLGMNNSNGIIGERSTRNGRTAVLWIVDDAGSLVATRELPKADGYSDSGAKGINDEGWIVGEARNNKGSAAVLWRPR
jgi:probable HAF family extracellular repeat protein